MKDKLKDMGEKYKEFVGKIEDRSHEMLDKWREKSNEFVRNFIEMYGTMVSLTVAILSCRYTGSHINPLHQGHLNYFSGQSNDNNAFLFISRTVQSTSAKL